MTPDVIGALPPLTGDSEASASIGILSQLEESALSLSGLQTIVGRPTRGEDGWGSDLGESNAPFFQTGGPKALGMQSPRAMPLSKPSKKSGRCNKSLRRRTLSSSKACANARACTCGSAPTPCQTRTEHRSKVRGFSSSSLLVIELSASSLLTELSAQLACRLACMFACGTQASMREAISVARPRGVQTSPARMANRSRAAAAAAAGQALVAADFAAASASPDWMWSIR